MRNQLPNSLVIDETTGAEIINIIQHIKSKSSAGFDNISTKLMKNSVESTALPMTEMFNSMV